MLLLKYSCNPRKETLLIFCQNCTHSLPAQIVVTISLNKRGGSFKVTVLHHYLQIMHEKVRTNLWGFFLIQNWTNIVDVGEREKKRQMDEQREREREMTAIPGMDLHMSESGSIRRSSSLPGSQTC